MQTATAPCHAVFTTSTAENFSPEFFSRILPTTSGRDTGRDIYLAGLNSSDTPLPIIATEVNPAPDLQDPQIASLLRVAKKIISLSSTADIIADESKAQNSNPSLEVLSTGLCHRPVTPSGRPIITRIKPQHYTHDVTRRANELKFDTDRKGGYQGGLYVCAGHGPWGISLSLGTGKVCADLLMGNPGTPAYLSALGL
jgi:glycine/D-amino acid oxidase-like deaminating enzyme